MSDFLKLRDYAFLSQAAYRDLTTLVNRAAPALLEKQLADIDIEIGKDNVFALGQAKQLTGSATPSDPSDGFIFLNQKPNTASGFSATVFEANGNGNRITIAVRGTEPSGAQMISDLLQADLMGVFLAGKAKAQLFDAYRYYKQLTAGAGAPVLYTQAELLDMALLVTGKANPALLYGQYDLSVDRGLGFIPANASVDFTGHSLGGHVTVLLADMVARHGGIGAVGDIVTYNAPGMGGILTEVPNWFGADTQFSSMVSAKTLNVIAQDGMNMTAGFGALAGTRQLVAIEGEPNLSGPSGLLPNHSIVKLSESLAFQSLLRAIDPNVSDVQMTSLVKALDSTSIATLERGTSTLYKLFKGNSVTINSQDRNALYEKINELQQVVTAANRTYTLVSLATLTAADLQSAASNPDAVATRYALRELNPFAILGDNTLYDKFNTGEKAHALDLYDSATGKGLTVDWIEDRSRMLAAVLAANTSDSRSGNTLIVNATGADTVLYRDNATGITLRDGQAALEARRVVFGKDQPAGVPETLAGGNLADHLYGNGGNDTLTGNAGDDTLEGGTGDDVLHGGAGSDTYWIGRDGGTDTVLDTDGQGRIFLNGTKLEGTLTRDANDRSLYHYSPDPDLIIRYIGATGMKGNLVIVDPRGDKAKVMVMDWASGELGLTLSDAPATTVVRPLTLLGDLNPIDFDLATPEENIQYDALGNVIVSLTAAPGRADTLYGSGGNDLIRGLLGDDFLAGRAGADRLDGGDGVDILDGGEHNDLLIGGRDGDLLGGGDGDDRLFADAEIELTDVNLQTGGSGRELLVGGDGNDTLVGAATADALLGGAGDDLLLGGAGDDDLLGDRDVTIATRDWTLTRSITTEGGLTRYRHTYANVSSSGEAAEGGADVLYGGAGNDWILAGGGDDLLDGGADADVLFGQGGHDVLDGGSGDDVLNGDEIDEGTPGSLAGALHGSDYLDGGDGADQLAGNGGADELFGGAGDDQLAGDDGITPGQYHGADYLDGEDGNDRLWGYGGGDTLFGGAGNDHLEGDYSTLAGQYHGADTLDGEAGDDELIGGGGNDTLIGGAGDDVLNGDDSLDAPLAATWHGNDTLDGGDGRDSLYGNGGDDILLGGVGNDDLHGDAGNDTLTGGAGTDNLYGGAGDDTYVLAAGDGASGPNGEVEFIEDASGRDTLRLDGIAPAQLNVYAANGDWLVIDYAPQEVPLGDGATDRVAIVNGMGGAIERIAVGGETLTYAQFVGRHAATAQSGVNALGNSVQLGGSAADSLAASGGNATLSGGRGNDVLVAGGNNNTLLYARGDGTDHVTTGGTGNVLALGPGIVATDLKLKLGSLALQIGSDPNDLIHFDSFDAANALGSRPFDSIRFDDGTSLAYADLLAQGFDLAGTAGNDVITGTSVADRIDGGAGNDSLRGGGGSDTYLWGTGGGQDSIDNADATPGKTDMLLIGNDADPITPEQLAFVKSGNDLIIRLRSTSDQVTVLNHYAGAAIDAVRFADGTTWHAAEIDAHITNELTGGADIYVGTAGNDVIDGLGGNDTLSAMAGDDILIGGAGADTLNGGAGADTLDGRNDAAADLMQGGADGDTYLFGRGSGADTITEGGDALSVDTLRLDAGIATADIKALRSGNDLALQIVGTTDQIKVTGAYATGAGAAARIERIEFADGTVWGEADIRQRILDGLATTGNDTITGFDGNDTIHGLGGNDTLSGGDGNDTLFGDDGNDTLNGDAGSDALNGGAGTDTLNGGAGGDVLDGEAGNDTLQGGSGNDTYRFVRGSGQDTLIDYDTAAGNIDTLEFGVGVTPAEVRVTRDVNHLYLTIDGTTDKLTLHRYFWSDADRVEQVRFADGTVWNAVTLIAKSLVGTDGADALIGGAGADVIDGLGGNDTIDGQGGNDTLRGGSGDDTLTGGAGDDVLDGGVGIDVLQGGSGNDTYRFGRGSGQDAIVENDATAGNLDTVEFGADVLPTDVKVTRDYNNHLYLTINGTADKLAVQAYFAADANKVEQVRFADGTIWNAAALTARSLIATEGADYLVGGAGADAIDGLGGNDTMDGQGGNDTLNGGAGNDTLSGGAGDDTLGGDAGSDRLLGGAGSDTYRFGRGDGFDTLVEVSSVTDVDRLMLGAGIVAGDVSLRQNGTETYLSLGGSADRILINTSAGSMEQIVFADGTVWDAAAIAAHTVVGVANTQTGTAGNDTFLVDNTADVIVEGVNQGTDTVIADVSYTLGANVENLTLTGVFDLYGTGNGLNNVLVGNAGDNTLTGSAGLDTMAGGAGNDTYYVGDGGYSGNERTAELDVIIENPNEGNDTACVTRFDYTLAANVENLIASGSATVGISEVYGQPLRGRNLVGNALDNVIDARTAYYTPGNDYITTLDGGAGDDILIGGYNNERLDGGAGNDTLDGGGRTDILSGGAGDDTYKFDVYSTNVVTIVDTGGIDLLAFGAGILSSGVSASRSGSQVTLSVSNYDRVSFAETAPGQYAVESVSFASGTVWQASDLRRMLNSAPTGGVTVSGTAAEGQTLTASNTLADADGIASIGYQWQTSTDGIAWDAISGAATDSLVLGTAQVGLQVRAVASYTDGHGTHESMASESTTAITSSGGNSAPTGGVGIIGAAVQNQTLSAANTLADADGIGVIGYQWQSSTDGSTWTAISGATADTFTLDEAQVGRQVRVTASYIDGHGTAESVASSATVAIANVNDAPTGAVGVGGMATQGQVLTASDTLADADGMGLVGYQWQTSIDGKAWTSIAGATAGSFLLTEAQVGRQVRVTAAYTDGHGAFESVASAGTTAIANINDASTGTVDVGGAATQGQVLTAGNTLDDPDGMGLVAYQWQTSTDGTTWNAIDGATTGSLTLTEAEVGKQVRVNAGYTDGHGTAESVASAATAPIANRNDAPTGAVVVGGIAAQNQILTATDTLADADGLGTIGYQWLSSADGVTWSAIDGATADSYMLTEAQVGKQVRVDASYIDGHGTPESRASSASAVIANINDAPTGAVTVTGIATQNQTLTATNTLADVDGLGSVGYQWQSSADGTEWSSIDGATADSFTPGTAQVGQRVRVTASYIDGHGTVESVVSVATAAIIAFGDPNQILTGGDGNDSLVGVGGDDTLSGGLGTDWLSGGAGNDTFQLAADGAWTSGFICRNDGSPGHAGTGKTVSITGLVKSFDAMDGGSGSDLLVGTAGNDVIVLDDAYSSSPNGLAPRFSSIERIDAGDGNDVVDLTSSRWGYGDVAVEGGNGDDVLWTSGGNDSLNGGAGNDTLDGGWGGDTMVGGLGNDIYVVDGPGDVVIELAGEGTDSVQSFITYTLGADLENLTLLGGAAIDGGGNDLNNVLTGNSANNTLVGGIGNDTLNGGMGADTLIGGVGNDVYVVDQAGDGIIESAGEGTDTVQSYFDYALGANLENLTLVGSVAVSGTGNDANNSLTGNALANVLQGGLGNDSLNGGAGADTLIGGLGDDSYTVDNATDAVVELAGEGTDTVNSSISYGLATNIERLALTGTLAIDGTGNELDNVLTGNAAANVLSGGAGSDALNGGAGADTLIGGLGNDTYTVDNAADVIAELAGEGVDLVNASVSYALSDNVENLTLTGSTAIDATGNSLDNLLTGNSAINILSGGLGNDWLDGKGGADTLVGGVGDDVYVVDNVGDMVVEAAGEGVDRVQASFSYTLGADVENLTLTGTAGISGTGNALDNIVIGTTGNNTLAGAAGNDTLDGKAGNDILVGGAGNDTYILGRGYGNDTVRENDAAPGNADAAQFLAGVAADQIWLRHVGNHLEASIIGTTDKLTFENWYLGSGYHVEQFRTADGKTLLDSRVESLVQAMAAFAPPAAGQINLPPTYQDTLAPVIAANWQ